MERWRWWRRGNRRARSYCARHLAATATTAMAAAGARREGSDGGGNGESPRSNVLRAPSRDVAAKRDATGAYELVCSFSRCTALALTCATVLFSSFFTQSLNHIPVSFYIPKVYTGSTKKNRTRVFSHSFVISAQTCNDRILLECRKCRRASANRSGSYVRIGLIIN